MTKGNNTLRAAGVDGSSALGALVEARAQIFSLTDATANAIVNPLYTGGLSQELRAAFACRIARLNGEMALADQYVSELGQDDESEAHQVADPSYSDCSNARLRAMVRHVDLVTSTPKDATQQDVARLRDAGVEEADIVRLSQVVAFTNYQVRVIAGLRLLREVL